jgi:hypothetical protein
MILDDTLVWHASDAVRFFDAMSAMLIPFQNAKIA